MRMSQNVASENVKPDDFHYFVNGYPTHDRIPNGIVDINLGLFDFLFEH